MCVNITNKKIVKETVSREDNAYVSIYAVLQKALSVELFTENSSTSSFNASSGKRQEGRKVWDETLPSFTSHCSEA
jgi:hypothetical protein